MTNHIYAARIALLAGASLCAITLSANLARAEDDANSTASVTVPKISVTDTAAGSAISVNTLTEGSKSYAATASSVGDKLGTPLQDTPNTISVQTRQYLDDRNISDVYDAMRQMPGVTAMPNSVIQNQYNARGYSIGGMFDGIASSNSFTTMQQLDMAIYDHLEFLHGADGLLTGGAMSNSNGAGGTINMVTKKAQKTLAASVSQSVGSWNNYRTEGDVTGPLNADGSLRARLVAVGQDRSFYYDNASQVKRVLYGEMEYDITPDTLATVSFAVQTNRQTPFYGQPLSTTGQRLNLPRSFNPAPAWNRDDTQTQQQMISLEHRFENGWEAKAHALWNEQYDRYLDTEQSGGVRTATNTTSYFGPEDYTYRRYHQATDVYAAGPFSLLGRTHKMLLGFNTDRYDYDYAGGSLSSVNNVNIFNLPTSITDPGVINYNDGGKNKTFQYGPYGQLRLSVLDDVTVVGGGRYSYFSNRTRGTNPGTSTNWKQGAEAGEFIPYAGVVYDVTSNVALYSSWSDIFVPQTNQDYQGNVLKPRQGDQYEVGAKTQWFDKQLTATVALYEIDDTNRPYKDFDHSTQAKTYYLSSGEQRTNGVDFEVTGKPAPGWDVSASYSYMISQLVTDSSAQGATPTNWYPRHMIKTWGKYTVETGMLKGLSMGAGLNLQSRIWGNGSNAGIAQAAYGVMDGMVGYELNDNAELTFNANNITDTKYFATTGRSYGAYNTYGDPQNFLLTLKLKM